LKFSLVRQKQFFQKKDKKMAKRKASSDTQVDTREIDANDIRDGVSSELVHLVGDRPGSICKNRDIPYVKALVGFSSYGYHSYPEFDGILIRTENLALFQTARDELQQRKKIKIDKLLKRKEVLDSERVMISASIPLFEQRVQNRLEKKKSPELFPNSSSIAFRNFRPALGWTWTQYTR